MEFAEAVQFIRWLHGEPPGLEVSAGVDMTPGTVPKDVFTKVSI